jgi:hypothetical protein
MSVALADLAVREGLPDTASVPAASPVFRNSRRVKCGMASSTHSESPEWYQKLRRAYHRSVPPTVRIKHGEDVRMRNPRVQEE